MTAWIAIGLFAVPLLAGALMFWVRPQGALLKLSLSFSGAFLLAVALLHMLPELILEAGEEAGVWLLAGFLLQVILEFFSRGLEHGHMHLGAGSRLPAAVLVSLCLHAFIEGVPFAEPEVANDMPFALGVMLHHFPVAIALALVLRSANAGGPMTWGYLAVFGAAAPAGIAFGMFIGPHFEEALSAALGVALGMFLHIATTIIFESSKEHRIDRSRFAAVLVGCLLALAMVH
ncbi:MAG: ZIP family metal transporter [Flavobacteriales bacterium]|nr:MAG: ZIP family metal transporter [Flavobacteriales bacterium]